MKKRTSSPTGTPDGLKEFVAEAVFERPDHFVGDLPYGRQDVA